MPMPLDLRTLTLGERIQHPFLVLEVNTKDGANGPFTLLALGNSSGRIWSAPIWADEALRSAGITKGMIVQCVADVSNYNGKHQLKISSLQILPRDSVPWEELLPSVGDVSRYWEQLDRVRRELRAPRLRAVLDLFYENAEFRAQYERCPASPVGHHAMLGGLLQHTWEVVAMARAIAKYARADAELVTAGALLHDIGKVEAYRWDGAFQHSESGALLGHVALGLLMLERRYRETQPPPCTPEELLVLQHLIGSHHGQLEFGATTRPMTLEAEVLHYADNASAKTSSMQDALSDTEVFEGDALLSAKPVWYVDRRRVWRGRPDFGR